MTERCAMVGPILTVGYGNRTVDELIDLLRRNGVDCLVDVRSAPYSKFKPEFSKEPLSASLSQAGIRYVFAGKELGGRPDDPSCYVDGKVDYDRVRTRPFFDNGIRRLQAMCAEGVRMALFCSELRPEECHRSKLIGVTLSEMSIPVLHLDEDGIARSQDEVIARLTGGQLDLFGGPSFTSRKSYGENK